MNPSPRGLKAVPLKSLTSPVPAPKFSVSKYRPFGTTSTTGTLLAPVAQVSFTCPLTTSIAASLGYVDWPPDRFEDTYSVPPSCENEHPCAPKAVPESTGDLGPETGSIRMTDPVK